MQRTLGLVGVEATQERDPGDWHCLFRLALQPIGRPRYAKSRRLLSALGFAIAASSLRPWRTAHQYSSSPSSASPSHPRRLKYTSIPITTPAITPSNAGYAQR